MTCPLGVWRSEKDMCRHGDFVFEEATVPKDSTALVNTIVDHGYIHWTCGGSSEKTNFNTMGYAPAQIQVVRSSEGDVWFNWCKSPLRPAMDTCSEDTDCESGRCACSKHCAPVAGPVNCDVDADCRQDLSIKCDGNFFPGSCSGTCKFDPELFHAPSALSSRRAATTGPRVP